MKKHNNNHQKPFPEHYFSKEILLSIREYVIMREPLPNSYYPAVEKDDLDQIYWNENQRSWRNFLSTQNTKHWKEMRKETFFWRLNGIYSMKYLNENLFREVLFTKLSDSRQQLSLSFKYIPKLEDSDLDEDILSNLFALDFGASDFLYFPPVVNVGYVNLHRIKRLQEIELGENIESIAIQSKSLVTFSFEEGIKELWIPAKHLTAELCRSVEKLEIMICKGDKLRFPFAEENYPNLRELKLLGEYTGNDPIIFTSAREKMPSINLPRLQHLLILNCCIQDISPCLSLMSLKLMFAKVLNDYEQVVENLKELQVMMMEERSLQQEIPLDYRKLTRIQSLKLSVSCSDPNDRMILSFLPYLPNSLQTLAIGECGKPFYLSESVRNLSIHAWYGEFSNFKVPNLAFRGDKLPAHMILRPNMKKMDEKEGSDDERKEEINGKGGEVDPDDSLPIIYDHRFHRVVLDRCVLNDYSFFRNTREIFLDFCNLADISPIAHVPVLKLGECLLLEDFEPLVHHPHQYLEILACNLKNEDFVYLSSSYHVHLVANHRLTSIDTRCWPENHQVRRLKITEGGLLTEIIIDNRVTFEFLQFMDCFRLKSFEFINSFEEAGSFGCKKAAEMMITKGFLIRIQKRESFVEWCIIEKIT